MPEEVIMKEEMLNYLKNEVDGING